MGALDWRASAVAMWVAQVVAVALIAFWSRGGALALSLNQLWGALACLFAVQIGVGLARIISGSGPWRVLREGETEATPKAEDAAAGGDKGDTKDE